MISQQDLMSLEGLVDIDNTELKFKLGRAISTVAAHNLITIPSTHEIYEFTMLAGGSAFASELCFKGKTNWSKVKQDLKSRGIYIPDDKNISILNGDNLTIFDSGDDGNEAYGCKDKSLIKEFNKYHGQVLHADKPTIENWLKRWEHEGSMSDKDISEIRYKLSGLAEEEKKGFDPYNLGVGKLLQDVAVIIGSERLTKILFQDKKWKKGAHQYAYLLLQCCISNLDNFNRYEELKGFLPGLKNLFQDYKTYLKTN